MELRKDPITRSWVRIGHGEQAPSMPDYGCPLCAAFSGATSTLAELPAGSPQVRVIPHFQPLYTIEGNPERMPDGIYDRMRAVGAHEIIIESPEHGKPLARMSDEQIERVLEAYAARISDLKRDARFKYVTVFKNSGVAAGTEWAHAHSQVVATLFVPRRVLYELRSARAWYSEKERCVFCDILHQEEKEGKRILDTQGNYIAFCPFASRVPFEVWVMPRHHNHLYEQPLPGTNRRHLAALLGRTLRRLGQISESYHMVVHTAPNTAGPRRTDPAPFWQTLAEDFHWHIEILPIVESRTGSYGLKEIYFNGLLPEQAAEQLRKLDPAL